MNSFVGVSAHSRTLANYLPKKSPEELRPLDSGHGLLPWAFARDGVPREEKSSRGRPERSAAKSKGDEVGAPGSARGDPLEGMGASEEYLLKKGGL